MAKSKNTTVEKHNETPSPAMPALFQAPAKLDMAKLVRHNAPKMYKPSDVPVGGVVTGKIIKFLPSPVSTIKGMLVWLELENGQEITFPVTGVIRSALAPGVKNEDGKVLADTLEKFVGDYLVAKRTDDVVNAKYKKAQYMFDVYTMKG